VRVRSNLLFLLSEQDLNALCPPSRPSRRSSTARRPLPRCSSVAVPVMFAAPSGATRSTTVSSSTTTLYAPLVVVPEHEPVLDEDDRAVVGGSKVVVEDGLACADEVVIHRLRAVTDAVEGVVAVALRS